MKLLNKWILCISSVIATIALMILPVCADSEEGNTGLPTAALVWIIVATVLLIVAVVLGIKFRANIAKGLRVYKSEFKKVSWLSWEQTRKSTLVVLVVMVACAGVICLLDFGLSNGFLALIDALTGLFA